MCRRLRANFIEHITSSYLTKIARYLLGDGVSSIEDRRSATLNRVALTSLKLADGSACWRSAMLSTSGLSGVEKVSRVHSNGNSLDHHLSGGGSGQLSPRSPSVADQRVKVKVEKLNVKCGNLKVQCSKSDVGSENLKDKC